MEPRELTMTVEVTHPLDRSKPLKLEFEIIEIEDGPMNWRKTVGGILENVFLKYGRESEYKISFDERDPD